MAKTEVILTHNVVGLGGESDQVKVAAGYARNYLLPQGLAIPMTAANKRRLDALRQRRAEREAHEFNTMSELAKGLSKMVLTLTAKTGDDGKMFGSITPGAIADELKHQFEVVLDKKKIHLEHPIKALGDHEIELRLHPEVIAKLKVRINSDKPKPEVIESSAAREARTKNARSREGETGGTETKKARPIRKPGVEKKEKPQ